MENFNKTIEELESHLDKWLYILKYLDKLDRVPEKIREKIFEKVFRIAKYENLSRDEQQAYENSLKYYRDLKNSLDKAFEEGRNEIIELLEQAKLREEDERRQKEEERKQKEEALKREDFAILNLYTNIKMPVSQIATTFNKTENEIFEILKRNGVGVV